MKFLSVLLILAIIALVPLIGVIIINVIELIKELVTFFIEKEYGCMLFLAIIAAISFIIMLIQAL